MRTLQLTDEQISLIENALGIAELKYSDMYKEITSKTIMVRNNTENVEQSQIANFYHIKSCQFADLNIAISNSDLDI